MEKAHSKPRIRSLYETKIRSDLMKVLGVDNQHAVPRLEKIVVNMGLGKKMQEKNILESVVEGLGDISGQRPVVTKARKKQKQEKNKKKKRKKKKERGQEGKKK